jgi:hypothetical protein
MIGLLSCLGVINYKLQDQKQWLLNVSFGIYLGWICIATIANVTTFLQSIEMNLNIEIQKIVSIIIIATGTVIITWVMKKTKNPFLSIAAAWAFYGIYSKQIENYPSIAYMALLCQAFIIVAGAQLIYSIFKNQ